MPSSRLSFARNNLDGTTSLVFPAIGDPNERDVLGADGKIGEGVSVLDFAGGVDIGDEVNDATAAIQAAIDHARTQMDANGGANFQRRGGFRITFPRGKYRITSTINCTG